MASGVLVVTTRFVHLACRTNRASIPAATNRPPSSRNLSQNQIIWRFTGSLAPIHGSRRSPPPHAHLQARTHHRVFGVHHDEPDNCRAPAPTIATTTKSSRTPCAPESGAECSFVKSHFTGSVGPGE